ncbi:MAG: N-acetyltransferase [Emergencia sp.]|nr:N-acetyltransferase [Emergencia sp.]
MKIRKACSADMKEILDIYAYARAFMIKTGNPKQWAESGYPKKSLLESDIEKGHLYVMIAEDSAKICGVFAYPVGPDPTYARIEKGAWPSETPYGTIHRIAGNGKTRGLLRCAVSFGMTLADSIRIDTHADNQLMQRAIKNCGFKYCGIIYAADGTPRYAYQLEKADWVK